MRNKPISVISLIAIFSLVFVSATTPDSPIDAKKYKKIELGVQSGSLVPFIQEGAGPIEINWKILADVTYKDMYVKELDAYYWKPTFGASVKALSGKEVFITGYVIPVDYDAGFFVVSKYPYANCFFCGGGGPESVVDLQFSGKHRNYKTDERLTFKGKLVLNADDIYKMNYILQGAVEYKP
ncbi:MAG: DUF3299 domain-containing protein [Bacteroidota bacterium]|jgi:hypothetical protein